MKSDGPMDDLLASVLNAYQMRSGVYGHPQFCGIWQFGTSGHNRAAFHFVGRGHCWLHTRVNPVPEPLHGGDLVVFPHDAWHLLTAERELRGAEHLMPEALEEPFTTLVCGYFEFLAGGRNPILDALPEVIVVRREQAGEHLESLGRLLLAEAPGDSLGTKIVLDKLADALFVMVVRHYVNHVTDPQGLLAALADLRLRKILSAMHREPAAPWTLQTLSQEGGMSRAAFAKRFSEVVGTTPMEYLTRWRMTQAELLLRQPQTSVASAAEEVGYETEAAFRKAYKRVHGIGPGAVRRWVRERFTRLPPNH